jgi:hypothetical protein
MAKAKIPGPLERRHLVEKALPAEKALAIAAAYLAEDRCVEAIDFLALAGAQDRLASLRDRALEEGDVFLLRAVAEAQDAPPGRDEWQRIAAAAEARGLDRYVTEAKRQSERGEE